MADLLVRIARFGDLSTTTLYQILRLRVDVFVVEQECPYPELDGRDTEDGTRHLWFAGEDRAPVAYLRILADADGTSRLGRVAVAHSARGTGLAGKLMLAALEHIGDRPCVLDAQAYLVGFYQRYGFAVAGSEYDLDGIAHIPMRRLVSSA